MIATVGKKNIYIKSTPKSIHVNPASGKKEELVIFKSKKTYEIWLTSLEETLPEHY